MLGSQQRLWLIGGTSESAVLAQAIAAHQFPCTITVTTPEAVKLYPVSPYLRVQVGQLNESQILIFIEQEQIIAIVDASHPYAIAISQAVIQIVERLQIPYLRYERAEVLSNRNVIELDSVDTLLKGNYLTNQRVLLTIGCKALPKFRQWQSQATLFARILPNLESIKIALESGFTPDRLIAIRPPINAELETALWQQWNISLAVSKASGQAGGEEIKQVVSQQLGIPLIIISRPKISYPQQTNDLNKVLHFCALYYSR
ncbi:MAG: cobalt-precorrin-6A reductase [Snowella sp.]|nr:cobalt-precorrin-6A reductase [Snowella sp.]